MNFLKINVFQKNSEECKIIKNGQHRKIFWRNVELFMSTHWRYSEELILLLAEKKMEFQQVSVIRHWAMSSFLHFYKLINDKQLFLLFVNSILIWSIWPEIGILFLNEIFHTLALWYIFLIMIAWFSIITLWPETSISSLNSYLA